MKKIILLSILTVWSFLPVSTMSCDFSPVNGDGGDKPSPPPPKVKDLTYYQKLLGNTNETISQFEEGIATLKNNPEGIDNFYKVLRELVAEEDSYLAIMNECLYQIMYLQNNGIFNYEQTVQVIEILKNKITKLTEEENTKVFYHEDYTKAEIASINNDIATTTLVLNEYLS